MSAPRSRTAPAGENYADDDSAASTLYARNDASASRSVNARRMRMAAENDVTFLQNRLSKLKTEEQRAKSEISKLKNKVDEVKKTREQHEHTGTQRRELQDEVDYAKRKEAALIALNKERQSKAIWASKQRAMQGRREAVLQMRKQKEINACRAHILREEQRDSNAKRRESIRQLHEAARLRREKQSEDRREATRVYFDERVRREEEDRVMKEKLAAQLVAQEAQMIYRLKRLHTEKQSALRDLAEAIDVSGASDGHSASRRGRSADDEDHDEQHSAADQNKSSSLPAIHK